MNRALLLVTLVLSGCSLVLGFEDKEPFPDDGGGSGGIGGAVTTGGATTQGGGGTAGDGGMGGVGGEPGLQVLLIPDRGEDSIGMYDPMDGTYIDDFVPPLTGAEPFTFTSASSAVQGPDGRIYVSDQLEDHIVRFEADGTFESIFADASDGLDNLRGIDFRDNQLYVSVSPAGGAFVARFNLGGNRLANFIADTSDPFDILFLPGGTLMMADITEPDNVRLYDVDASSFTELAIIDFPSRSSRCPTATSSSRDGRRCARSKPTATPFARSWSTPVVASIRSTTATGWWPASMECRRSTRSPRRSSRPRASAPASPKSSASCSPSDSHSTGT